MSRQEYVSPEGLRLDGRRPGEVRRVRCSLGVLARADGSAMYEQGNTRVMAAVYGPREVTNRMDALPDRAIIKAELSNASFSASERKGKLKHDRRANELALLVQEAFEAAIIVQLFPNSQIDIFLQIMQVDGGRTAAAINAATLALIDAGVPMRDFVVCCHAGFVDNTPIVDLNYAEECSNCADMPVAIMPNCGDAVRVGESAEDSGDMAVEAAGDEASEGDGAPQLRASGDSIVMMQLDRRLPLEHFESLGAKCLHSHRTLVHPRILALRAIYAVSTYARTNHGVVVALLRLCLGTVGVAADGARQIYALLKEEVRQHTLGLAESRGAVSL